MGFGKIISELDGEEQGCLLFKGQKSARLPKKLLPFKFYLHPRNVHGKLKILCNAPFDHEKTGWDSVRKQVYRLAGYKCACCGGRGAQWPVAAADVWTFQADLQELKDIIALCPSCNEARYSAWKIHQFKAKSEIIQHVRNVTGFSEQQVMDAARRAVAEFKTISSSRKKYILDVRLLKSYGVPGQYILGVEKASVPISSVPVYKYTPGYSKRGGVVTVTQQQVGGMHDPEDEIPEDMIWDDIE